MFNKHQGQKSGLISRFLAWFQVSWIDSFYQTCHVINNYEVLQVWIPDLVSCPAINMFQNRRGSLSRDSHQWSGFFLHWLIVYYEDMTPYMTPYIHDILWLLVSNRSALVHISWLLYSKQSFWNNANLVTTYVAFKDTYVSTFSHNVFYVM